MGCFLNKFDLLLNRIFYRLGKAIATNPGYFIIIPIFISAILATGLQNIVKEDDPEYLFTPTNGQSKNDRKIVESYFKLNYTAEFTPSRITRFGSFIKVIITAKDGESLLRTHVWNEIVRLNEIIQNINITDTVDGETEETYRYEDICALTSEFCYVNNILDLQDQMPEIENKTYNLTYPFMFNSDTFETYAFPFIFGGMEVSDSDTIESVSALQMLYWLRTNNKYEENRAIKWEQAVLNRLEVEEDNSDLISNARYGSITLKTEMEKNSNSAIPFYVVTFAVMLMLTCISIMSGDCVRTKPWLGLSGIISVVLAVLAAFGLLTYLGVEMIGINFIAPFLMLGIGIDDTFVMLAAWRRTKLQDSVAERMANTYSDAAVSITITSITDMISFFIGVITPFPSVQIFCIYTGTAVLMTYMWHITFFGGCLALAGYAEQKNKHGVSLNKVKSVREAEQDGSSGCYRVFCAGGISEIDPNNAKDNKDHMLMALFRDYLARFLNIPAVKALVVMIFFVYLLVGCWGCTKVKEGLEPRHLARYDSYFKTFCDMEDKYFKEYPHRVQVVLTGDIEYSDPQTQEDLMELHQQMENSTYVDGSLYTESWIASWLNYLDRNNEYLNLNISNEEEFISELNFYYLTGPNNPFTQDVTFNENYTKIIASRFIIQTHKVMNSNDDRDMMEELREIAQNSRFNVTVYTPLFLFYDQYVLVRMTSIQAVCLAAAVTMVVSLVFLPNPLCSLWVAFSIVSIEIGVVGYMTLWGVNLDVISMINLIVCIGFSVDFSAHITYAYLVAKVDTPEERVKECLFGLGLPILQGALSTIIGIIPLIMTPSYVFITFFKTIFLVTFFGAMHGIFLLPVLLSLLGPGSCKKQYKKDEKQLPSPNHQVYSLNDTLNYPGHHGYAIQNDPIRIKLTCPQNLGGPLVTAEGIKYNTSFQKDLGYGTSEEDSRKSSLSKRSASHRDGTYTAAVDNTNINWSGLPIQNVYSNRGYVYDDIDTEERRVKENHLEQVGQWEDPRCHYAINSHSPAILS